MPVKVLLIEPDDSVRSVLTRILRHRFPQLEIAGVCTPVDAITMMREGQYDIILCDALLVREDKVRFFQELCGEQRETSLVIVTGDTSFKREDLHAPERGLCVQGVVYKPVMIEELSAVLQEAIAATARRQGQEG